MFCACRRFTWFYTCPYSLKVRQITPEIHWRKWWCWVYVSFFVLRVGSSTPYKWYAIIWWLLSPVSFTHHCLRLGCQLKKRTMLTVIVWQLGRWLWWIRGDVDVDWSRERVPCVINDHECGCMYVNNVARGSTTTTHQDILVRQLNAIFPNQHIITIIFIHYTNELFWYT